MRSKEIRLLRWRQVNFEKKHITVGEAKTEAGKQRVIPMRPMLEVTLSTHASWYAATFGPLSPEWYVFPFCNRSKPIDPTRPVTSLKTAWGSIRKAAGVRCRIHDLRHTVCTKMAEAGVPEAAMLDIMGHMSAAMLRRYSHIRQAAKAAAMQAVEDRSAFSLGVPKESPKVEEKLKAKAAATH